MDSYFLWASVGLLTFFLLIGFLCGLVRGLKRSSLHIIFFIISIVVAFCITKTVTSAILGITISVEGSSQTINGYILKMITEQFDLGAYSTATEFLAKLPMAIVSPILFILLSLVCYIIFDILYLIVARVVFGKKKKDFKEHKPHRWFGSLVGVVEGFLFLFVLFAPLTALTKTYSEITYIASTEAQVLMLENEEATEEKKHLQTIPEMLKENIPNEINDAISAYNNSILGKVCGAGGLDKALFDGLSSFKLNGQSIKLRSELLNLTDTYNNFVVVYNNYIDLNFTDIDLTKLKKNIESFLNNGIFKTVVADTVKDLIVNYEFDNTNPENPKEPNLIENILLELKEKFSEEGFNVVEYLKHDITALIDTADGLFKGEFIKQATALTDKTTTAMMEVVGKNNDEVQTLVDKIFDLNLVKDAFPAVADFLKENLKDAGEMIAVNEIESTTDAWKHEIALLGQALKVLATNTINVSDVDAEGKPTEKAISYIAYVMAEENPEQSRPEDYMQKLFKDMTAKDAVSDLLTPVFESKLFTPLVDTVFKELDNAIESFTGVAQVTDWKNMKETKPEVVDAISQILDFALNVDMDNFQVQEIGKVLDILKNNAKAHTNESGKPDGVFNETFVNIIWYLTGDKIVVEKDYAGKTTIEYAEQIKTYLGVKDEDVATGYYNIEFEKALKGIQDVVDLAKKFDGIQAENVAELVTDIVDVFENMDDDEKINLINTAQEILKTANVEIIPEGQKAELEPKILEKLEALENENTISSEVSSKLKELLGLTNTQA